MKLSDKIGIVVGFVCMLLVMWHTFTPKSWHIEGFWGTPLIVCMFLVGYGIACKPHK